MNETLKVSLKNRRRELEQCPHCKKKPDFATWSDGRMEIKCANCSETNLTHLPYGNKYYHQIENNFHKIMNLTILAWNNSCTYIYNSMKKAKSTS